MGERDDNQRKAIMAIVASYIALALAILGLWLLVGCKPQEVIVERPVVVEHTTTHNHTDIVRDTLVMRDSVFTLIKGDTLLVEKWHYLQAVTNALKSDTVRDTVPVVTEVVRTEVREVAKPLSWWQKTLQWCGGIALALFALRGAAKWWLKGKGM